MAAVTSVGTKISIDGGSSDIAQVLSISAPSVSISTVDTTDLDATWKTFMSGTRDGGDCTFEIAYDPSNHTAITTAMDGTSDSIVITYSDAKTCNFSGIITGFSSSAAIDDKLTASITIKVTGQVTFPS